MCNIVSACRTRQPRESRGHLRPCLWLSVAVLFLPTSATARSAEESGAAGSEAILTPCANENVVQCVKADPRNPLVEVAAVGETKRIENSAKGIAATEFGPISDIRRGAGGDYPWRVKVLSFENGGEGLIRSYSCLFTISNYWPYGYFSSKSCCELPGKLFRARASGNPGDQHHFLSPAFWKKINRYRMVDGRLYIAWRVKAPKQRVEGGRFSYVSPSAGPWRVWCNRSKLEKVIWTVELLEDGKTVEKRVQADPQRDGWFDVQLVLDPRQLTLQINQQEMGRFSHDADADPFYVQIGSAQTKPGGDEVLSEYREVFLNTIPYPYKGFKFAEGPEDIRPGDEAIVGYLVKTTPQHPRASEGDIVETKDGNLLAVYSDYYAGTGWDGSPARIVGTISKDGGRTWGKPWTVADRDEGSQGNVMSASLLWGKNGDLIMVYHDKTPEMGSKSMLLRRSSDGGKTWSKRIPVTPAASKNRHCANNASLTRLSSGRIILATREYIGGIRWPYACYSDDDGRTWKAGKHVPDPGLTPQQKRGQNVNEPSICELADGRLLMTMRSVAGGQFFSWSKDQGETWSKPVLSPLRGTCSPAVVRRIPGTDDVLALWTYGYANRTPLVSAISSDGGLTWKHLKLLEQSQYHGYCYASCTFAGDRVVVGYMHYPMFSSIFRFEVEPGYHDGRFISLPIKWFYRDPGDK